MVGTLIKKIYRVFFLEKPQRKMSTTILCNYDRSKSNKAERSNNIAVYPFLSTSKKYKTRNKCISSFSFVPFALHHISIWQRQWRVKSCIYQIAIENTVDYER